MIPERERGTVLTPDCAPRCAETIPARDWHAESCPHYTPDLGTAWCTTCGRSSRVIDRFDAGHMTRAGEVEYAVTALACGHEEQGTEKIIGPAPGVPYAGPQTAVAASTRSRDLLAAHRRQAFLDGATDDRA